MFLNAVCFHLVPEGRLILNVPAGRWVYSAYDVAAGHVRRYAIATLSGAARRSHLEVENWTYWGLPLTPLLVLRKLWLAAKKDQSRVISSGFDTRSRFLNSALGLVSRYEPLPQKFLGSSLMATLRAGSAVAP